MFSHMATLRHVPKIGTIAAFHPPKYSEEQAVIHFEESKFKFFIFYILLGN